MTQHPKEQHQDRVVEEILRGYCRDIPLDVTECILAIYRRHGLLAAMDAARAVVTLQKMHQCYQ